MCVIYTVNRAAAIARANEAKKKMPTPPQQSVLSNIGRDLDRYGISSTDILPYWLKINILVSCLVSPHVDYRLVRVRPALFRGWKL